ncbi:stalk domain-containing protein [Paenibacillus sp. FSL R7-0345]|uniref:stalk domain-containing protein n=1 Tax=Paenibacillus sp. FSL R7-0345 TaxID=2954535 RepID=UPI003159BC2C
MKKSWLLLPVLLFLLGFPPVTSAASTAYFTAIWENGGQSTSPALLKEGVVYTNANILESAGLLASRSGSGSRTVYTYSSWKKSVTVTTASKTAKLDGQTVSLGGKSFVYKDELYLPARFVVGALGGETVSWNAKSSVYTARNLHFFSSASAVYGGVTYTVDKQTGKLYAQAPAGQPRLIANLGSELYDMIDFNFRKTDGGLLYLTIKDIYGEPHINNKWYTLILKDGMVIRQASVGYWQRYGDNVKMYGDNLILTDGKLLRVIEDGTGKVKETLDLVKLGGIDDKYLVEAMDDDFLLIRPNQKGLLMLIDRNSGNKTLLYKELLDADQQLYAETNDIPFYGDRLEFTGRTGNLLKFKNQAVQDGRIYEYDLSKTQP